MRGHHPTLRLSRIVRPREHDLAPIVDPDDEADEFFDDVIEPPLDAGKSDEYFGWRCSSAVHAEYVRFSRVLTLAVLLLTKVG